MLLLERETQLAQLTEGFDRALHGQGRLALVHGEAGAGKSSLIQHFLQALPSGTTRLVGGCEPLFTARPFGPLVDIAEALPPTIAAAVRDARRSATMFVDVLAFLRQSPCATVLVIDDLHWADAGTLDFVRYVGRRLAGISLLFVATFRDDDIATDHPLRRLLGDLPAATTTRIAVPCLSKPGVAALARNAQRGESGVFEVTGGNPFFVTEILNATEGGTPSSVTDAIAGRMSQLTPGALALAELVAVSPKWIERCIVAELVEHADALMDECIGKGLLRADGAWLSFRHELARQVVEQGLRPGRSGELHRRLFAALGRRSTDGDALSRLVHHARSAGLRDEILSLAPRAARAASGASAHREAARLFALAVEYATDLEPAARAELLELAAAEYRLVGDADATIAATQAALELRFALGDDLQQGLNLRRLATAQLELGKRDEAESTIARAVAVLERTRPSVQLVLACAEQSRMRAWSDYREAVAIGSRAIALAEPLGDSRCMVEALHACMLARLYLCDDREARTQLERALDIAIAGNMEDAAAHLFVSLQLAGVIHRDHVYALDAAARGLAYCEARDLDGFVFRLLDNRALSLTELGRWDEADADLDRCLADTRLTGRLRNSLAFLKARQNARRGIAGSEAYWLGLQDDMRAVPLGYRLPAVAAACAEAAWLRGDLAAARRAIGDGIDGALASRDTRLLGPLRVWARRCGLPVHGHVPEVAPAHACELAGDIATAAAHWQARGCVFERILTLLHGDREQVHEALRWLDALGARPAADIARQRLRALGERNARCGPQPRTRNDPMGLTRREREVYELLTQGLSNAAIAARLHRSERTVESHVACVLSKLHVGSRIELIRRARQTAA